MKKKSKTQEYLEAQVIFKHGGKIDLAELWKPKSKEELEKEEREAEERLIKRNTL